MESIPVLINWTTGVIEIVSLNLTQDIILDEIEEYRKRIRADGQRGTGRQGFPFGIGAPSAAAWAYVIVLFF